MPVLTRSALEASPLADLHAIAGEVGIDGFRRLRKAELVDAILVRQGGEEAEPAGVDADADADEAAEPAQTARTDESAEDGGQAGRRRSRGGRGGRGRARKKDEEEGTTDEDRPARREPRGRAPAAGDGDRAVEGTIELLPNGSGFVRVSPPEPSEEDVYVSAAQVRRCELVSGDAVSGPVRPPRRSERYPSLVRVDTINGRAADEVAEGTPFDELPAQFPTERFTLAGDGDDATLKAIEWLTPLGRGSRAAVTGPARAGKSEALRRIAGALNGQEGLELSVVLAGARPEELGLWKADGLPEPAASLGLAASAEAQAQAIDRCVETAKRIAARGGHAVVLIDSLAYLAPAVARKALAAARSIVDGGSLTVIAAAPEPVGGETTVIALDRALTSTGRFPALDLPASGTLRPDLLVGDAGAEAIAQARATALEGS